MHIPPMTPQEKSVAIARETEKKLEERDRLWREQYAKDKIEKEKRKQ
jgi:hypothetical protein